MITYAVEKKIGINIGINDIRKGMKKVFTLIVILGITVSAMAQHGAMKFAGKASFSAMGVTIPVESDTLVYSGSDITVPEMVYNAMMSIPSFTIHGVSYSMNPQTRVVEFPEQDFSEVVEIKGSEYTLTGKLEAAYAHADNSFNLTMSFTGYGPPTHVYTYTIAGYYVKNYTDKMDMSVGTGSGALNYSTPSATYSVRIYPEDDTQKMDVQVQEYNVAGTVMGDMTVGMHVIKGLTYDSEKGGYYRNYSVDEVKAHIIAESGGSKTIDADYVLNNSNILVMLNEKNAVTSIIDFFTPGAMPMPITTTFPGQTTAVKKVEAAKAETTASEPAYNLMGQLVGEGAKGIVIIGGKKYLR